MPSEDREQMVLLQWFARQYPGIRIHSIPNGGHRHIVVAARLKATGQRPGVPDLFVPAWRLWIEMKRQKGGTLSPDQRDWIEYLRGLGYWVIVGRGFDNAAEQIQRLAAQENLHSQFGPPV